MDKKIIEKYKLPLKDAFDYIGKKKPVSKRKQWTSNQRDKWMLREPNCPICKEAWSEFNIMTKEHIHPIVLGGQDRDDNHVPLCQKCNSARNNVMVAVLGSNNILAIRNRMPALKGSIEEFVVWCHATISKDYAALEHTNHLTQTFLQIRGISDPYSIKPTISTNTQTRQELDKTFLRRGLEFAKSVLSKRTKKLEGSDTTGKIRVYCKNTNCKKPMNIPTGYQGKFRCPKCKHEQSLLTESISSQIMIASEMNSVMEPTIARDVSTGYPVIKHLNSASAGLKLPRDPKDFVESVRWFVGNAMDFETLKKCTAAFKETNTLPKSRASNTLIRIIHGITSDGIFLSIQEDDMAESIDSILQKILDNILSTGIEMDYVDDKDLFIQHLKEYFTFAKNLVTAPPQSSIKEEKSALERQDISKHDFHLIGWLNDNWEGKASYPALREAITNFENKKESPRKFRDVAKEDFDIPKGWNVGQIVKRMNELLGECEMREVDEQPIPSASIQTQTDHIEFELQDNQDNELTSYLQGSINKRIPTKTYQYGFSASQLAYIFKEAKEHFDISWNELFKPFDVKGTIQEKSVATLSRLGFITENEIGSDEVIRYKIVNENRKLSKTDFSLTQWLNDNWEGKASYPALREAITNFENKKESPRKFRDVAKEDFDIPKGWNVRQIVKRMNVLKQGSSL